MPAKTSDETAWKLLAIDRLIDEQQAHIVTLEKNVAALAVVPDDPDAPRVPESHREYHVKQLMVARDQLAALKAQKRKPGTLLTLAHLLLDDEGHDRLKAFPKGSEKVLAALKDEQRRINQKHFERNAKQRENSEQPRPQDDGADVIDVAAVIAKLAKQYPEDTGPKDLWPHLEHALRDVCSAAGGHCEAAEDGQSYEYSFAVIRDNGTMYPARALTYREFCKLLSGR